jgi:hypothetical protein
VIFYSALQSAPTSKTTKTTSSERNDSESIDDTEKVLEDIKRKQSSHNDDNFEISKSPNQLNRFNGLQLEDENDEKQQIEIQINNEESPSMDDDDDEEDEEEEEEEDLSEEETDEDIVEQIREDILAYEQSKETQKKNLSIVVNREELIYLLKCLYIDKTTVRENILTIGMVIKYDNLLFWKKKTFFNINRLDIQMLVKVQQLILYYNIKKYLYHQHLEKLNIFK